MLADYHVHTDFSHDSFYPLEQVVRDAIALGLEEICITDHVDYGVLADHDSDVQISIRNGKPFANVDYPRYAQELQRVHDKYQSQIRVRMGLEFGVQTHTIQQFASLFGKYSFDFILLSIHQIEDKELWTGDFQHERRQKEYYLRYYKEMLRVVESYKNYSVLAHMDLIKRYDKVPLPFESVRPIVAEILRTAIADGKGLEFNTSYLRYGLAEPMPAIGLLQLYRDLGGSIITIGSDSHAPGQLGTCIREAQIQLKALGFKYFCTFEQMQPQFHML